MEEKTGTERLTAERIDAFLDSLREKGRSPESLKTYRQTLTALADYLPEDRRLDADTGPVWRAWMAEQGLAPRTINARMSVWNSYCQYIGRREWVQEEFFRNGSEVQPELTRTEYLRLLQTAKILGREKSYLLIKTLGGAGLRIQELPQLTVEAVRQGTVGLRSHNNLHRRLLRIPASLREELLDYIRQENIARGPVFLTAEGVPLSRVSVYRYVYCVAEAARVDGEKANPRCLWKMYLSTCESIQANLMALAEQTYQRMLETEQLTVGWNA